MQLYARPNCVQLDKENAFYRAHSLCVTGPVWQTCSRCRGVFHPYMMDGDCCHQCAPYVAEPCEVVQ